MSLGEVLDTQTAPGARLATPFFDAGIVTRLAHLALSPARVVPSAVSLRVHFLLAAFGLASNFI
jgi:hypothetical protein